MQQGTILKPKRSTIAGARSCRGSRRTAGTASSPREYNKCI